MTQPGSYNPLGNPWDMAVDDQVEEAGHVRVAMAVARWGLPAIYVLFTISYMVAGMMFYYGSMTLSDV